jgi:protein-L-isoaspartate(D-aspartate) O-methyltransferase
MVFKRNRAAKFSAADFAAAREQMVRQQVERRGISDARVLRAMLSVPREEFVDASERCKAYEDYPLPIGYGQTISQPFTVAFQCEALRLTGEERVLEIGTGSGYCAAVLSHLAKEVVTIERRPELAATAAATLQRLGFNNVHVIAADGTLGLPNAAPFDGILVTAGGSSLPAPYVEQLAPGGRIVIPLGRTQSGQSMFRYTKLADELRSEDLGSFSFVPLIGRYGWDERLGSA